ncbi:MAG TPA: alpha-L-fucosidase, partial [Planctomycetota bacterium]
PAVFAPTALDCRQWARVAREAGMQAIILTAKHHDGFCLWPSARTEHDVAASPWKDGRGDVLGELAAACRAEGLRLGVYLSPWDRNHPLYGSGEAYNEYFRAQLREVLTGYGEIFEVWFDGANGEGPGGRRQEYDWPGFLATVREFAPGAVIFSDAGPDVRWVGNERGFAGETNWNLLRRDEVTPGWDRYAELTEGHADGTHWVPAECDVSIRPGWFHHPAQDDQVKSVGELLAIWYGSVGRGANLLLNLPVDRRGLVHENDVAALRGLRAALDATFVADLARGRAATAENVRGGDERFGAAMAVDGDPDTYWAADDEVQASALEVEFGAEVLLDHVVLREAIALGQRVEAFTLQARTGSGADAIWVEIGRGTTIGRKRILQVPVTRASALRLRIAAARACPTVSTFEAWLGLPKLRLTAGDADFLDRTTVAMAADQPGAVIRYTLDGSEPKDGAAVYAGPFVLDRSATLRAVVERAARAGLEPLRAEFRRHARAELRAPLVFVRAPDPGLRYAWFEGDFRGLEGLASRVADSRGVAGAFDLSVRARDERGALRFEGLVRAPGDGIYRFSTSSDDGSRLWIGDDLVVDNDGLHGMQTVAGSLGLQAGWHPIAVEWFNATGGLGLEVRWQPPGDAEAAIPAAVLAH